MPISLQVHARCVYPTSFSPPLIRRPSNRGQRPSDSRPLLSPPKKDTKKARRATGASRGAFLMRARGKLRCVDQSTTFDDRSPNSSLFEQVHHLYVLLRLRFHLLHTWRQCRAGISFVTTKAQSSERQ